MFFMYNKRWSLISAQRWVRFRSVFETSSVACWLGSRCLQLTATARWSSAPLLCVIFICVLSNIFNFVLKEFSIVRNTFPRNNFRLVFPRSFPLEIFHCNSNDFGCLRQYFSVVHQCCLFTLMASPQVSILQSAHEHLKHKEQGKGCKIPGKESERALIMLYNCIFQQKNVHNQFKNIFQRMPAMISLESSLPLIKILADSR